MNTNKGNYCLIESEKISQALETFKLGFQKKNILPGKGKIVRNGRIFFEEDVVSALNVLGSPFRDRR